MPQQELLSELTTMVKELDTRGGTETVRDPERLQAASQRSLEQSQIALDALRQAQAEGVREHGNRGPD